MVAVVMFLSGLGLGGCVVWALVSYTAVNPVPWTQPEECWTVQSISARIELERLDAARTSTGIVGWESADETDGRPNPRIAGPARI